MLYFLITVLNTNNAQNTTVVIFTNILIFAMLAFSLGISTLCLTGCVCNSIYDDEEHKGENVLKHMSRFEMTWDLGHLIMSGD